MSQGILECFLGLLVITFIFDTETTGLIENRLTPFAKQPEIIEFYGCLANLATGEVAHEIDSLCKPSHKLSEDTTRITGITDDDVKNAPLFRSLIPQINSALEKSEAILAHNLSFDMDMVELEYDRVGAKIAWPPHRICTVEETIHYKGFRLSLTALHEFLFNESFPEAHRAKHDVVATLRCAVELFQRGDI